MSGVEGGGIVNPGGGGTGAAFTLNGTSDSVSISAGAGIGIGQNASTITISASAVTIGTQSLSAGANSVSGTAVSLALAAGANITFATATAAGALTISIAGPTVPAATNFALNGSSSSVSLVAGAGIGLASNASTISISASVQTASLSLTALGNTTSSSAGTATNLINFSGAGAISVGVGAGSVTISGPTPVNFSTISLSASGNTTGATSSGTANNVLAFSGMSGISVGVGNGTISISGPTIPAATTFGIAVTAGNTAGATSSLAGGYVSLYGGANITLSQSASSITISGAAGGAAGTQSLSAGANSVTGTGVSLALFAGNNIGLATATAAGALSVTVSNSLLEPVKLSLTQNIPLQAAGLLTSTSGTITGTAGFGSSLFLQRLWIEKAMTLSEADMAIGLSFPATSQGAGTLSRYMVVYSFGNSTSLASVISFSSTSAWATGTSTTAGAASLTAFQGGWAGTLIQPMTFATSSISGGEYVIGNLINFAQGSSTWSLSLYGQNMAAATTASVITSVTSASTNMVSNIASLGPLNLYELSSNTFAGSAASAIASATSISTKSFSIQARTLLTASSSTTGISAVAGAGATITGLAQSTLPSFGFIGTGSTTSAFPFWFSAGIMSTGAVPTAITLTSAAVTYSGSIALIQPWFALVGS